jgi:hypothetical protein
LLSLKYIATQFGAQCKGGANPRFRV